MSKPNIIFLMVDQLSAKWIEEPHCQAIDTPSIDRLRNMGVSFTNAITSNPVCCPTRATIATGLTTRGHGVLQNGYELDPNLPTFMHMLQQNGWKTGAFGKVHFHAHFHGLHPDYRPYGFDVVHNTEDPRGGEWLDWVAATHPEHLAAALATIWPTHIPEFSAYGPDKENLQERIETIRATFDWATERFPGNTQGYYTLPFPQEVSQTEWITARALEFLRDADANEPVYAHISYVQPHSPFCAPEEYMDRVDVSKVPTPVRAEWLDDPHAPRYFDATVKPGRSVVDAPQRHYYYADILHLDEQIGKILAVLEQTRRLDHSYLVFLSDHGELLGDHGFFGKEERHYDACIRVPLIVAGPGLPANQSCDQLVQHEDIFPTVLQMASLPSPRLPKTGPYLQVPQEELPYYPGRSLFELCTGESSDWREAAYSESYNAIWSDNPMDWARTVRTKRYRYTYYPAGGGEQLFDLQDDPDETRNLVGEPSMAAVRQELRDKLLELVIMQDYPWTPRALFNLGVH